MIDSNSLTVNEHTAAIITTITWKGVLSQAVSNVFIMPHDMRLNDAMECEDGVQLRRWRELARLDEEAFVHEGLPGEAGSSQPVSQCTQENLHALTRL